ncbi:hypothetical protein QBC39DRAFT_13497 [Podospora conica]|nr:hypothetical protein QBC39DRAFT_13497 [Schizothecium conicum]
MATSRIHIPDAFSWLLSAHGLITGVVIYSAYYVFSVSSIPFILTVVAAALHLLLATYLCFTGSRPGTHHLLIIPPTTLIGAGLWAAVLYYFASALALLLESPPPVGSNPSSPLRPTWIKVGTATAAANVALDFSMLAVFLLAAVRRSSKPVISAPVMYPAEQQQQVYPTYSPPPPQQQQQVYPTYSPPPQQQQQQQQQQVFYPSYSPPPQQHMQQQYQNQYQPHPNHGQQAHYSGIYTSASPPPPADYKSA